MSAFYGRMGAGAAATLRQVKRAEATERNANTPPNRRAAHRRPCPTGKHQYATEARARAELVGAVIAKNRGDNRRKECRIYECPLCGHQHLTSSPQRPEGTR